MKVPSQRHLNQKHLCEKTREHLFSPKICATSDNKKIIELKWGCSIKI